MGVPVYCIYSWMRIAYYLVLLITGEAVLSLISMAFLTVSSTLRISYISLDLSIGECDLIGGLLELFP